MKKGFTLSEVLIVLVIIGIIAGLTINVIKITRANEYRTAYKKALATLNDALQMEYAKAGKTSSDYKSEYEIVENLFKNRLNIIEISSANGIEWPVTINGNAKLTGCVDAKRLFATQDGFIFCVNGFSNIANSNICDLNNKQPCGDNPNIYIDVNGLKGPNMLTEDMDNPKDQFMATIYNSKVIPVVDVINNGVETDPGSTGGGGNTGESGGGLNPAPPDPDKQNPDINEPDEPDEENPYFDWFDPSKWSWKAFLDWLRSLGLFW